MEEPQKTKALLLYCAYAKKIRTLSSYQKAHTWNFLLLLLSYLPRYQWNEWKNEMALDEKYIKSGNDYMIEGKELRAQKRNEAIDTYTRAIEQDPFAYNAYYNRGLLWRKNKNHEKAKYDFKKYILTNSGCACAFNHLAWLYATCEDKQFRDAEKALILAKHTVKLEKKAEYLDTLACAYAEAGDFEKALETAEEVFLMDSSEEFRERIEIFEKGMTYAEWKESTKK